MLKIKTQSTYKMLQQIGQDMTMTEQQLRVHNMQTRKTVQLKRVFVLFFKQYSMFQLSFNFKIF
jgi:hypothetical protein